MNQETKLAGEVFVKKQMLTLFGAVDETMLEYVSRAILDLTVKGSPPIHVIINSGGGEVREGLQIYDQLQLYAGKKTAIVVNCAASMAAVILQACDNRFATRHSLILIHNIRKRVVLDDVRSKRKWSEVRSDMEKLQSLIYAVLMKRTGKTLPAIRKQCAKDKNLYAEEAKSFNLIDGIWEKALPENLPIKVPDKVPSTEAPTGS